MDKEGGDVPPSLSSWKGEVTMIRSIREIPTSRTSYPFTSAARYVDLDVWDYQEKEYYVEGTANVYESVGDAGAVAVRDHDAPYTNRIVVRAPKDPSKASGNVVVEIINPTSFMEIERMWILGYEKFLRDGDIYVGITSKPNTIAKLVEFNPERYGKLSWPNPRENTSFPFTMEEIQARGIIPDMDIHYEPGLFWDMLTDLAWLLRGEEENNPVRSYDHRFIYLTGWSQSACYLFRYVNSFAYRDEVRRDSQVFDGYLAGGGVRNLIIPVNQYESTMDYNFRLKRVEHMEQPYISVQTESENSAWDAFRTKRPDSDYPYFLYREYEVTGASHDTMSTYVTYYRDDEDLKRIHHLPAYVGKHAKGNDYPSRFLFAAAYKNLFRWVREGVGPNSCPRIPVDEAGNNRKDVFGNTRGGLRTCLLNYPTGRYHISSTIEPGQSFLDPLATQNPLFGYEEPFSSAFLRELYGSLENYEKLCREDTKEQISKGFLCKEDGEALVQFAVSLARERGLV